MDKEINFLLSNKRSLISSETDVCLNFIKERMKELEILRYKSDDCIGGWKIPRKWEVNHAFLKNLSGDIICDYSKEPLSLLGYSSSYKGIVETSLLKSHLFYIKDYPDAIPYVTSYYKREWGFCMRYDDYINLSDKEYYVDISTEFQADALKIGSLVIKGQSKNEILFSTYTCHPTMMINESSGILAAFAIYDFLKSKKDLHYSYRFSFFPETIGSIVYKNELRRSNEISNILFTVVLTCLGYKRMNESYMEMYSQVIWGY